MILTGTPLKCTVVTLCHGDLTALVLEDCPFHILQWFTDGVHAGVNHVKIPDQGLGGSWVVSLTTLTRSEHSDKLYQLPGQCTGHS